MRTVLQEIDATLAKMSGTESHKYPGDRSSSGEQNIEWKERTRFLCH